MSNLLAHPILQSVAEALQKEKHFVGNQRGGRITTSVVILAAAIALLVGLLIQPDKTSTTVDPALVSVIAELEAGLQTVDEDTRAQLVTNAFCRDSAGSGAVAMLANIPPLLDSAANEHGRVGWVSLSLHQVSMQDTGASGSLAVRYNQKVLPNTPLPAEESTIPVQFKYRNGSWCIV